MQSLLLTQCDLFYLLNAFPFTYSMQSAFIDLMQSFLFLSNAIFLKVESNRFLFMNVMCFIYLMQSFLLVQCNLLLVVSQAKSRSTKGASLHLTLHGFRVAVVAKRSFHTFLP